VKIVHLVGWYFPDSVGGSEVYVQELCSRQRSSGIDVRVAAPRTGESSQGSQYVHHGVTVFRYAIPQVPARGEAQGREPIRGHEALRTWLEQVRPDVLHVHSIGTGIGLDTLEEARALGARIVLTAHLPALGFLCQRGTLLRWGTEPCDGIVDVQRCAACALEDRGAPRPLAHAMALAGRSVAFAANLPGRAGTAFGMPALIEWNLQRQRRLLDVIDRFVVLNERARAIVLANGGRADKVVVNRLGVGFTRVMKRDARVNGAPVRVGFVGRIHRTKGVAVLAQAVLALPRDVEIRVELRGPVDDSTLLAELQGVAAQDPRLTLGPPVDRAAVPDLLASYDVLCCPSAWFENGPTVALEAQAVGTPVIGTDVGAMPEFITDGVNGRIVPTGDWRGLRDALAGIARAPQMIEQWRGALPRPRTMDDIAADYEAVYRYAAAGTAVAP
jgi:glycosyltransferase involved in cell wall biosynthesis